MTEIPATVVKCAGCDEDLNVLNPYLQVQVKAQREILVAEDVPASGDPNVVPEPNLYLGVKSGRGVILRLHDFDCLGRWQKARKGLPAKLEFHKEEGDPYVPEDNRTPEELVAAGELPKEFLAYHEAASEFGAPVAVGSDEG
jgi:hypothetical protein